MKYLKYYKLFEADKIFSDRYITNMYFTELGWIRYTDAHEDDYINIEKYIKPLKRNNEQYGWYVYIDRVKADFGGVHIPLDESKISATEFIKNLKNQLAT